MTISVRIASSSHCSILTRFWFFRIAARRNRIAAHRSSRNFLRFSRWMMIGSDAAREPPQQEGVGEHGGEEQGRGEQGSGPSWWL